MRKILDIFSPVVYHPHIDMKKVLFVLAFLAFLALPTAVLAEDEAIICPQPYGGGVVCGIKHEPVETGIADSLPVIGSGLIGASALIKYLKGKFGKKA